MTKISYIHGVPQNEVADRSKSVRPKTFLSADKMTDGQMYLALLRDRVRIFGDFYGNPAYKQAESMIDNALYAGVHGNISFTGDMRDPVLQAVAAQIKRSKGATRSAMGLDRGINARIGDLAQLAAIPLLGDGSASAAERWAYSEVWKKYRPYFNAWKPPFKETDSFLAMGAKSVKWPNDDVKTKILGYFSDRVDYFKSQNVVIQVYNDSLEKSAHHLLYHNLNPKWAAMPTRVDVKRILHGGGVSALAQAGDFSQQNMSLWVENGVLRKNIERGIGPENSVNASFILASGNSDAYKSNYDAAIAGAWTPEKIIALVTAITAALGAMAGIVVSVRSKRPAAFGAANNLGTEPFSAQTTDWPNTPPAPVSQTKSDNLPLIIGAAAAGYLLLSK